MVYTRRHDRSAIKTEITAEAGGERIDVYVTSITGSRNSAGRLIDSGGVTVNGRPVRASYRVKSGDRIAVTVPDAAESEITPEYILLSVIYEDGDLIIIDKPKGMVVHPAPGHNGGTLVNALLHHCGDSLSGIGGVFRPGIVHRLDKDTSGLLAAAKIDEAHRSLSAQLQDRTMSRVYEAIVTGGFKEDCGVINMPIGRSQTDRKKMAAVKSGGRHAITRWEIIERYKGYTHIRCILETGRTHQIRVHLRALGRPVLGDSVYGAARNDFGLTGQCLHACELKLVHPRNGETLKFKSPLPEYFTNVLGKLKPYE